MVHKVMQHHSYLKCFITHYALHYEDPKTKLLYITDFLFLSFVVQLNKITALIDNGVMLEKEKGSLSCTL